MAASELESIKDSSKSIMLRQPVQGKSSTLTKVHTRCTQTNRTRSVNRLLKISRHRVRQLAVKGNIPGCTEST